MLLYTIWIKNHGLAVSRNIAIKDVTVKSGDRCFSPSCDIVRRLHDGIITVAEYTEVYHRMMVDSYNTHTVEWISLLSQESVAISCYCNPSKFCHRFLLAEYLEKVALKHNIDFVYGGELLP